MWTFLRQLVGSPPGCGASSRVSLTLNFSPHIRLLAAAVAGLVSLHCNASISRSAAFKLVRVAALFDAGEWRAILVQICSSICVWLSLQTDYAIRPCWTPLCRGVNNCRNSPAKSGRLIGCAPGIRWLLAFARFSTQGYQVTPRLRTLFHAGASGDSFPSHTFLRRGIKWLLTFVRRGIKTPRLCMLFCAEDEVTPCTARAPYRLERVRE